MKHFFLFHTESNEDIPGLLKTVIEQLDTSEKELKELKSQVAKLQSTRTYKEKEKPKISKVVRVSIKCFFFVFIKGLFIFCSILF